MAGKGQFHWHLLALRAAALVVGAMLFANAATVPVTAASDARTLWLYHTHTQKTGKFTYYHDGKYDQAVLQQLNLFLADWRTHNPTKMDPHLFDLLWEVYQDVGGKAPYNIVSSYREPKTNAMLRAKSSGVAENSQHMLGKAMDVFIPGVKLSTLRAAAMRHQVGGVGYYPTSGSPFVHMDTGGVRAWPRMTRAQLKQVFPDGKTLHLPVDGTPLSSSGTKYAQAQWNECHMVPCPNGSSPTPVFEDESEIRVASLDPAQRTVSTIDIVAPTPMSRPGVTPVAAGPAAIMPFSKTTALMVATLGDGQTALGAISGIEAPTPRSLSARDPLFTAYAPEPGAQRALELIIERETAAATPPARTANVDISALRPATTGGTNGLDAMKNIFDMTWQAVTDANGQNALASTLTSATANRTPVKGLVERSFELVPPEIDHVDETLTSPVPLTDGHFAELYEPEGFLDKASELGPMSNRIGLESNLVAPPRYDVFVVRAPTLVAARG